MEVFLTIYFIVNVIALLFMIPICSIEIVDCFSYAFVYPYMNDNLNKINLAGKTIIYALFTLAFLPALISYYILLFTMILIAIICEGFFVVFRKRS